MHQYVDKHGRFEIVPFSDSTVRRFSNRKHDPFPAGQLIGGKRYWRIDEIEDWLARQDTSRSFNSNQNGEAASP